MENFISKIFSQIQKDPEEYTAYDDLFSVCRNMEETDFKTAHEVNSKLRSLVSQAMKLPIDVIQFFELSKKSVLFYAPHFFDSFLFYLEVDRKPEESFYQPRRRVLQQVLDNLRKLVDDDLDELFISMPPRTGKTSLLKFLMSWLIGRKTESSNLYSAYSDTITKAFYTGGD